MKTTPIVLVLIIVFSAVMIVVKLSKTKETKEVEKEVEKPMDPFEIAQIRSRGVQLLESLSIVEITKDIQTLRSRIDFMLGIYSTMVVLAVFKHKYVAEAEKAMNTYQKRYPNKYITEGQAALLLQPDLTQLKNHLSNCVVLSYAAFVKEEIALMEKLMMKSAIKNREEKIIRVGYDTKYLFKTFDLPDNKHLDAIEEIRKQFYSRQT